MSTTIECRLAYACLCAYAIAQNPDGSGYWVPTDAPGYDTISFSGPPQCFVNGDEYINACYVGETTDDWVILAFRGTLPPFSGDFWAWIDDWLQDFEIGPETWKVNGLDFGQVETGFATATSALYWPAYQTLVAIPWHTKQGLIITGHSKGAAAAFLSASLFKAQFSHVLTEVCAFAAPLCSDQTYRQNLYRLGVRPFLVRYQNEYDLVPYLPWYPTLDLLAKAERRSRPERTNLVVTQQRRLKQLANDYVPIGFIRYLTTSCAVEYGEKAEVDAWAALQSALEDPFDYGTIVDAHSMAGRYMQCPCGVPQQSIASRSTARV